MDHIAFILDLVTLDRIDALRPLVDAEGREATRSDVLRLLIRHGLRRLELEEEHQAELRVRARRGRRSGEVSATRAKRGRKKRAPAAR